MHQAINADFISVSQGGNYNQKPSMLLYQMQMKLNKKDLSHQANTEFLVFVSSKGHYFKVILKHPAPHLFEQFCTKKGFPIRL
jgi:hypothetical protein